MAHFGISSRYNCENGSRIAIEDERYISLGRIEKGKKAAAKLCKVKKMDSNEIRIIKIMNYDLASKDEVEIQMKLHEVKQVARIYSWTVLDKSCIAVMEYVEASDWQKAKLQITWRKMLKAVEVIHNHGILHLDLHLGNIILNQNGEVKILDFGQSIHLQAVNFTSICISKPKHPVTYASPEYLLKCKVEKVEKSWTRQSPDLRDDLRKKAQMDSNAAMQILEDYNLRYQVGSAADIWSLCSALYQLMYGELPYDYLLHNSDAGMQLELDAVDATHVEKIYLLMDKKEEFIFLPYPKYEILRDTVMRCLVRDPNQRPTIKEMLSMLEPDHQKPIKVIVDHFEPIKKEL